MTQLEVDAIDPDIDDKVGVSVCVAQSKYLAGDGTSTSG
jgi:hypothetical protein